MISKREIHQKNLNQDYRVAVIYTGFASCQRSSSAVSQSPVALINWQTALRSVPKAWPLREPWNKPPVAKTCLDLAESSDSNIHWKNKPKNRDQVVKSHVIAFLHSHKAPRLDGNRLLVELVLYFGMRDRENWLETRRNSANVGKCQRFIIDEINTNSHSSVFTEKRGISCGEGFKQLPTCCLK